MNNLYVYQWYFYDSDDFYEHNNLMTISDSVENARKNIINMILGDKNEDKSENRYKSYNDCTDPKNLKRMQDRLSKEPKIWPVTNFTEAFQYFNG